MGNPGKNRLPTQDFAKYQISKSVVDRKIPFSIDVGNYLDNTYNRTSQIYNYIIQVN